MADQSSSSDAFLRDLFAAGAGSSKVCCCLATSCCVIRWKGLVSLFFGSGLVTAGVLAAEETPGT